jgi:hypothetical protein
MSIKGWRTWRAAKVASQTTSQVLTLVMSHAVRSCRNNQFSVRPRTEIRLSKHRGRKTCLSPAASGDLLHNVRDVRVVILLMKYLRIPFRHSFRRKTEDEYRDFQNVPQHSYRYVFYTLGCCTFWTYFSFGLLHAWRASYAITSDPWGLRYRPANPLGLVTLLQS